MSDDYKCRSCKHCSKVELNLLTGALTFICVKVDYTYFIEERVNCPLFESRGASE